MQNQRSFIDGGIALAGITAYLYCASTAYYGGYLWMLHLDGDLLDRNFHQILYNGFLLSFAPVYTLLAVIAVVVFIYAYALLPEINEIGKLQNAKQRIQRWLFAQNDERTNIVRRKAIILIFTVFCFFGFIKSLSYYEHEGRKDASNILNRLYIHEIKNHELIIVEINNRNRNLFPLACGSRNCAAIDPNTRLVFYFPQTGFSYGLHIDPTKVGAGN